MFSSLFHFILIFGIFRIVLESFIQFVLIYQLFNLCVMLLLILDSISKVLIAQGIEPFLSFETYFFIFWVPWIGF